MINKLDLTECKFGTKFSGNEENDTCFNAEYVLLGHNFDFLDVYCPLSSGYCWLLLVTL